MCRQDAAGHGKLQTGRWGGGPPARQSNMADTSGKLGGAVRTGRCIAHPTLHIAYWEPKISSTFEEGKKPLHQKLEHRPLVLVVYLYLPIWSYLPCVEHLKLHQAYNQQKLSTVLIMQIWEIYMLPSFTPFKYDMLQNIQFLGIVFPPDSRVLANTCRTQFCPCVWPTLSSQPCPVLGTAVGIKGGRN